MFLENAPDELGCVRLGVCGEKVDMGEYALEILSLAALALLVAVICADAAHL